MTGTRAKAEEIFYQKIEDLTKTNDPSKDKAFTRWICQEYFPGLEDEMDIDEAKHAETAKEKGAAELPKPVKKLMGLHSKVMTTLAYWI